MQSDFGFLATLFSLAQSQEWTAVFKVGALVVIADKATKVAMYARRSRNGGTDHDKLSSINVKLDGLVAETREMRHEQREAAIRQADALDRIAAEARHNNETQAGLLNVIRELAQIQARKIHE